MKQLKSLVLVAALLLGGTVFAKDRQAEDIQRLTEYNKRMKTIPYEIGPLKDPSKLPFKVGEPKNHKKEAEMWLRKNMNKYKADSSEVFGDPVLIRFRDKVGYGICVQISGDQVFAGFNGSVFYLFLFNGDLIIDVITQTMLLGMDEVDDARVKLLNAEVDHACISIVASGLTLDNPENPTSTSEASPDNKEVVKGKKK